MPEPRPPRFHVPDQGDDPVVWDTQARTFVGATSGGGEPERRQWFVGTDAVGVAPPPREGGTAVVDAPAPAPAAARVRQPLPDPRPQPQPQPAPAGRPPRRRRRWLRRPKLRWILAVVGLLPVLLFLVGWWYASNQFGRIEKVPVSEVLSPAGGGGTNYLIVGSDSREAVADADHGDPNVQPGGEAPPGQRSDTMLVLRIQPDGAKMLSIPRDLWVTYPDTGREGRVNGAYNDGPANLIRTVRENLQIPVHRYLEVDFVTFSSLVDALDGITLSAEIVPCAAHDDESGLNLPTGGPITVDGATALAFVRSRHYTDCNGTDPTGDLGRIVRQQAFLRTVLSEAGASRNPLTLLRIAGSMSDGLRVDDGMGLWDAVRFAWNMGRLDPESVVLPTRPFRTNGGAAVLGLVDDQAPAILDQFR